MAAVNYLFAAEERRVAAQTKRARVTREFTFGLLIMRVVRKRFLNHKIYSFSFVK